MATRTRPTRTSRPRGRTLHLLDVENLAGGTGAGVGAVAPAFAAYRSTVRVLPGDHVVVGTGPTFAYAAAAAWPGARVLVGHGLDGADLALVADVDPGFVTARYDRVVVGSGDHLFCSVVSTLRPLGLAVLVVATAQSISRDLRRLAPFLPLTAASPVALAA